MTTILDSALTMPRTCVAADQVIALDSVGSTNTYAAELVRKGAQPRWPRWLRWTRLDRP